MDALQLAMEVIDKDVRTLLLSDVSIHRVRLLVEARAPGEVECMKKHRNVSDVDMLPQYEYDRFRRDRAGLIERAVELVCAAVAGNAFANAHKRTIR